MNQLEIVAKLKERISKELLSTLNVKGLDNLQELFEKTSTIPGINLVLLSILDGNSSEVFKFLIETIVDDPPLRSDIDMLLNDHFAKDNNKNEK